MSQQPEVVEAKGEKIAPLETEAVAQPHSWLIHILRQPRRYNSSGDIAIRSWIVAVLKEMKVKHRIAAPGNIIATVGTKSTTLFSCHTDTVHNPSQCNGVQPIIFDPAFNHIFLDDKKNFSCLGADDGAGIYVMLRMIQQSVPGTYVFHVGEEQGGIGARELLKAERSFLEKFDRAIAFDRAGDNEVIITQGGQPCASSAAGQQIADRLNEHGLKYELSTRGMFTDTKVYAGVIPECFNLGVGYMHQHTAEEYLDVAHVEALIAAATDIDWEAIKPTRIIPPEPKQPNWMTRSAGEFEFDLSTGHGSYNAAMNRRTATAPAPEPEPEPAMLDPDSADIVADLLTMDRESLEIMCEDQADVAALAIIDLLAEVTALRAKVETLRGFV